LIPHSCGVGEVTHWLPTQQPAQLFDPQVVAWQEPFASHVSPALHTAQAPPSRPQDDESVPVTHRPLASQQPLQLSGPQKDTPSQRVTPETESTTHCSPFAHVAHWAPPDPHVLELIPARH
jgi:hypothetical protein